MLDRTNPIIAPTGLERSRPARINPVTSARAMMTPIGAPTFLIRWGNPGMGGIGAGAGA
ncbi:Uncharacterised protein [Mycobacteroides abscessus subsp. massiliense]|nr:Uncharacterised protein [Mycobacteroides abscessus subsp. massiliense]